MSNTKPAKEIYEWINEKQTLKSSLTQSTIIYLHQTIHSTVKDGELT